MLAAYISQNPYGRLYHALQRLHLARHRYTGLEYAKVYIIVHLPHRQRNTYLAVKAAGTAHYAAIALQQLIEPLLYGSLATASRDADNGHIKPVTVTACNRL